MNDLNKFRRRYVAGVFLFIGVMFCLGLIIGDSYLFALVGIAGWVVFLGLFLRYLSEYRGRNRNR